MDNETLRKVQLVQLEIAKEIDLVCSRHNIKYFLIGGTLIGAVRHNGFIPWDDDFDIGMMRSEYNKFLEIAPKVLGDKYKLIDWKSDPNYPHPMAKIIKNNTIYKESKRKDEGIQGIWVDIFPYDNIKNQEKLAQKKFRLKILRSLIRAKNKYQTWITPMGGILFGKYLKNIPFRILALFVDRIKIIEEYECLSCEDNNEANFVFENGTEDYLKWCFPKVYFMNLKYLKFEDYYFRAPLMYDEYLKAAYGNYMELPPEDERENRHLIEEIDLGEKK